MTRLLRQRIAAARGDDGAVLIFALLITTTIALVVTALLTRGNGSLRATVELRSAAGTSYAADAAAKIAINNLRTGAGFASNPNESGFNNSLDGVGCFGNTVGNNGTDTLALNNFYPATGSQQNPTSAVVECTGVSGTGQQGSPVPINNSNKPGYAIITLNGPLTTSDNLKVHGGIYSNSTIAGQVTLDAGDAWAYGACTNTTVTAPATKHCNAGVKISDPNYSDDLGGTVPTLQTPPTSCTGGIAIFQPGYYDNASTLSAATSLCSVAWFKPGTYYFDFHNDSCANVCPSNLYGTSGNVWRTGGNAIIGGTPVNASGTVISQPSSNPTLPGSCQSPITDTSAVGVQFVFGGSSQMYVDKNAQVELCGSYHSNRPPIVVYGLKTGNTPTATTDTARTASSVPAPGLFTGATTANLAAADGAPKVATWTTTSASAQSTSLTAQGFAPSATVPQGAVLTAATLHVRHQDADATSNSNASAKVTIGTATTAALPLTASASMVTTDLAITGANLNTLQTAVHDNGYTSASVAYTANAKKNNATTTVDMITLDLTYYVPVLRGETGTCVDGTAPSCKFLSMPGGNNKILLYLQGTTYVPLADVDVQLGNFSAEVAKFGIVARQVEFAITNGNPSWTGPIFEIPDNSPGYGYSNSSVDLKVHLCPGQATCSTSAATALTSRVQIWDPSGAPAPPGRQVSILSWSHNR
ncbi:hypothetical protein [Marmoricola sp. RAF53]|uniref:hypothetical protein n=1 Tax=Marmoricola sp. RAF53 TaxID=3233059 RepID=UPI003F95F5DF